jgi:hypothetical protein
MNIKAWLDGDDVDLRCLADLFPYRGGSSFWIDRRGGGRFYLSAPELDHPPALAVRLVAWLRDEEATRRYPCQIRARTERRQGSLRGTHAWWLPAAACPSAGTSTARTSLIRKRSLVQVQAGPRLNIPAHTASESSIVHPSWSARGPSCPLRARSARSTRARRPPIRLPQLRTG